MVIRRSQRIEAPDAIIIGGGHNGLVCAGYLARGGLKVVVLESRREVGGGAVTSLLGEGFKLSACAHLMTGFDPDVARDLKLARQGFKLTDKGLSTIGLARDGRHLFIGADMARMKRALGAHSTSDAEPFEGIWKTFGRLADVIRPLIDAPPPLPDDIDDHVSPLLRLIDRKLDHLKADERRLFHEIAPMSICDLVEKSFETDALKGLLAALACLGHGVDPRAPGTAFLFLLRLAFEERNGRVLVESPRGGLGALTQALAEAAKAQGADVRTNARVTGIELDDGRAVGVTLDTGERLRARAIISNVDPKTTFLSLLPQPALDTGFRRRLSRYRLKGTAAKINLALRTLPSFTGLTSEDMAGRLIVAPSLAYVQNAYGALSRGAASEAPMMEIVVPSIRDPSLAPNGRHVMSVVAQYVPYEPGGGDTAAKERFAAMVGETIALYAPDIGDKILDYEVLTPADIETRFGLPGGDWHHGEMALDQMLWLRPAPGAANYTTPVGGLYLCGAGTHPGGGVAGVSGRNCAKTVLERERGK